MSDEHTYHDIKRMLAEIAEAASHTEALADDMSAEQLRETVRLLSRQQREALEALETVIDTVEMAHALG